jgi:catechol 2,3-dioxygenase-like lactoylglutathione lyase family enzyme
MTESLKNIGAITLFVEDAQRSKAFYETVFDAAVVFEDAESAALKFDNTLVNVLARSAAPELIEPAVVGGAGSAASLLLTVWVKDADAACAQLAQHGVELLNGPLDRDWGVRTAAFADPDGHIWEIAQQIGAGA